MKIKVSSSYSGAIPVAEFSNVRPGFSAEYEFDPISGQTYEDVLSSIDKAQKDLQAICYANFKTVADAARIEKIKNDMKGFRFYPTEHGEYPSVTTIITPEYVSYVTEDELRIATSEGNICHARAAHFISTGEWLPVERLKEIEGIAQDLLVCKGRFLDVWNFPAMLKKFEMKEIKNGCILINHQHRYAGTNDGVCFYPLGGEKGAELVPTIFDFKRSMDRDKNFTQMAAYASCPHLSDVKQMMVIKTNTDTDQGFSKPVVSSAIPQYFEVFLSKRKDFQKNYGI